MVLKKQKRIAIINDFACYGKCALMVSIPILSAMNIETCPVPTVLLSSNGAFPDYYKEDKTEAMAGIMEHWKKEAVEFDAIMIGFLNSVEQIELVKRFIQCFKQPHTTVFLDPIMGDHGKFYSVTDKRVAKGFLELLPLVDIMTPNLTECCQLLELEYPEIEQDPEKYIPIILKKLTELGPEHVVITGVKQEETLLNYCYSKTMTQMECVKVTKIGEDRCGTGDVFASVLFGSMLQEDSLFEAVKKASEFLVKAITYTIELGVSPRNGISFERYLKEL